ncbi:MAG: GNAT family N-acetyltransferase [Chloroflexi bacterium]|nr:GNAT family N-acetyltransferase [Chloroflexota bacterium]
MSAPHPLQAILRDAASGRFPPPDGRVEVFGPPSSPADAVIAFTAHHVIAADVDPEWVRSCLDPDDVAAPMNPAFLAALGERLRARPGIVDAVFCAHGVLGQPGVRLVEIRNPSDHPRVERALAYRTDVRVYATPDGDGMLVLGRGLVGRREAAFEVVPEGRGRGLGRALVAAARHLIPEGEPLFIQVAPGNVASVRAIIAAGFKPIAGEVLFLRQT